MTIKDLVSEDEALRLYVAYGAQCHAEDREFQDDEYQAVVEQLAHSRLLGGMLHNCMQGHSILRVVDGQLEFKQAPATYKELFENEVRLHTEMKSEDEKGAQEDE